MADVRRTSTSLRRRCEWTLVVGDSWNWRSVILSLGCSWFSVSDIRRLTCWLDDCRLLILDLRFNVVVNVDDLEVDLELLLVCILQTVKSTAVDCCIDDCWYSVSGSFAVSAVVVFLIRSFKQCFSSFYKPADIGSRPCWAEMSLPGNQAGIHDVTRWTAFSLAKRLFR